MNKLQQFIQRINERNGGFLHADDMPELISIDRLCQVLVRCGGCRFVCSAQDVTHLEKCIVAGRDYVRDVSFPVGALERAADWKPELTPEQQAAIAAISKQHVFTVIPSHIAKRQQFDENDCSGVFDGNQVTSDAGSGL